MTESIQDIGSPAPANTLSRKATLDEAVAADIVAAASQFGGIRAQMLEVLNPEIPAHALALRGLQAQTSERRATS